MTSLPSSVQFYLDTCQRVLQKGVGPGFDTLSPLEKVIFHAHVFDCEEQTGGLSQFFYNTDSNAIHAEAAATTLDEIGLPKTAALLRQAALIVCKPEAAKEAVGTWGEYLQLVDPGSALNRINSELTSTGECVAEALEDFISAHQDELTGE